MTWTAGKVWASLDVLTHTDLNTYIGSSGNLFETVTAKATAAGQVPYATGSKAVAMLTAGAATDVLHSGTTPSWGKVTLDDQATAKTCRIYNAGNLSIVNNTLTSVTFDTEQYDVPGWHNPASNPERITFDRSGTVVVMAHVQFAAGTSGVRRCSIEKNGTEGTEYETTTAALHSIPMCRVFPVVNTDYVRLTALQVSGGALNLIGGAAYTFLQVVMLPP